MPLIFNGVTIPNNESDKIIFNGNSINTVIFNGIEVWKYIEFFRTWSGSSIYNGNGLDASGSQFRSTNGTDNGAYISVDSSGVFENKSSLVLNSLGSNDGFHAGGSGGSSQNGIKFQSLDHIIESEVLFVIGVGFTGSSLESGVGLETLDGKLRYINANGVGSWVTLT